MGMSIQNRSVLYKTPEPVLVPEGVYEAELVEVKEFSNAFGNRVGLVFKITTGQHEGVELMRLNVVLAEVVGDSGTDIEGHHAHRHIEGGEDLAFKLFCHIQPGAGKAPCGVRRKRRVSKH